MAKRKSTPKINIFLTIIIIFLLLIACGDNKNVDSVIQDNAIESSDKINSYPFQITIIDVGQGDAAFIECDNHYMMIDGGPVSASSIIYSFLESKGIEYLDYIINTHPDDDHIGGLSAVLNKAKVGRAFSPYEKASVAYGNYKKYANQVGVDIENIEEGEELELGSAKLKILSSNYSEGNNSSIVVKIIYGNNSFLFMGDAEEEVEEYLMASNADIKSDLLKIAHHGSKYSTSEAFLERVSPDYAIISVGKENNYDHPSSDVLLRLSEYNVKTYRTDINGDIIISSDGNSIEISTEKNKKVSSSNSQSISIENNKVESVKNDDNKEIYVLNIKSKRFHYSWCQGVSDMAEKNKEISNLNREEIIKLGYKPCGTCNP